MRADEVELAVGQRWLTLDATSAEVVDFDGEDGYTPWQVRYADGTLRWLTGKGRYHTDGTQSKYDLAAQLSRGGPTLPIEMYEPVEVKNLTAEREYTGGSVRYYCVRIDSPTTPGEPYTAECNDIIEALGMNYAEGNAFKALWRRAAARTLGKAKQGYTDGLYDAEKVVFFGQRLVAQEQAREAVQPGAAPYIGPDRRKGPSHG